MSSVPTVGNDAEEFAHLVMGRKGKVSVLPARAYGPWLFWAMFQSG